MSPKQSFFNLGSGIDPTQNGKVKSSNKKIGCNACGLYTDCNSPRIPVQGEGKRKILIISEYPGKYADKKGDVYSKGARKILTETLSDIDIDLEDDCWSMLAVRCSMHEHGEPTDNELALCRPKVLRDIEKLNPEVIITLGTISLKSLIGHRISGRLTGTAMNAFYGEIIPDQEIGKYICPTYSPDWLLSHKLRERGKEILDPVLMRYFKRSIKAACKKSGQAFYKHNYESEVMTTTDPKQAVKWINKALKNDEIILPFDYESDGLKPHEVGHELTTASFSDGLFGYSFPFFRDDEDFMRAWFRLMRSKKVKKIAHKMDFENMWTRERGAGEFARGWYWDTCLAAHCINSHKPTGQKFWAYCYLGIMNYDDSVDKYLKSSPDNKKARGCNAFNNIHKADLQKVLIYNAQDSHLCYKIYDVQRTLLKGKFLDGFKFFLSGAEVLSHIQHEGMLCDMPKLEKHTRILTRKIDKSLNIIKSMDEYKLWNGTGKNTFNPNSDPKLKKMLYELLGYDKPDLSRGQKWTDKKQLQRIGTDFTKSIIPYREYSKMKTYLDQFNREQVMGIIRPFFNLHIPATFRSSADSPNFQNMPARDFEALKWVMACIICRDGNKLIEWDYKGVEVTVSACVHKDPTMVKYLIEGGDMHYDTTAELILKDRSDVTKDERQEIGKNGYVFPSFYGSGPGTVTPNIWELIQSEKFVETKRHLKDQGITKYRDYYAHVEDVHKKFWNERFPVYRDWKRKIYNDFLKKGYVDLATGFRYYGPATFMQVTNAPIQGPAFHCLLWSLTHIFPEVKANFDRSTIIGQIHDAAVGDIHPDDEKEIDGIVKLWGTEKVREHWDWITLPLKLEKESTEVNGSWNTMKGRGFI